MPTAKLAPYAFSPAELDAYLAKGWRPYGQTIYVADFIQMEIGEVFGVVPTRLSLTTHQWRKSQRKLLRQNDAHFNTIIRPAILDEEKIRVNLQYMQDHPDKSLEDPDLSPRIHGKRIFNTMECSVYEEIDWLLLAFLMWATPVCIAKWPFMTLCTKTVA
ncbi:MAG: hypothetical protein R2795_18315 [Saprospiraceae bacterium]